MASFRFVVVTVISLALVLLSAWTGSDDYRHREESYRERKVEHAEQLAKARVYSQVQPVLLRQPSLLSIFDRGCDARFGTEVKAHLYEIPAVAAGGSRGNELMRSSQELDITKVVEVVFGLLALLMSFDAFVGERKNGTLAMVLAHGVSRRSLLMGKFLGGLLTLVIPLTLGLAAALLLLRLRHGWVLAGDQWLRLGGLYVAYVLYLVLMLLIGMFLSEALPTPSSSLLAAIFFWFAIVFCVPQMVVLVASDADHVGGQMRELDDALHELEQERVARLDALWDSDPTRAGLTVDNSAFVVRSSNGATLHRFGTERFYTSLEEYFQAEVESGLRYAQAVFARRQLFENTLRDEERLARRLSFLSPALLLDLIAESMAVTSTADMDRFLDACRRYRREMIALLERQGGLGSRRWFTDDLVAGSGWPGLLGLSVKEVEAEGLEAAFSRFGRPEVSAEVQKRLVAIENDPARQLPLQGLPRFEPEPLVFRETLKRNRGEWLGLLLLVVFVGTAVERRVRSLRAA